MAFHHGTLVDPERMSKWRGCYETRISPLLRCQQLDLQEPGRRTLVIMGFGLCSGLDPRSNAHSDHYRTKVRGSGVTLKNRKTGWSQTPHSHHLFKPERMWSFLDCFRDMRGSLLSHIRRRLSKNGRSCRPNPPKPSPDAAAFRAPSQGGLGSLCIGRRWIHKPMKILTISLVRKKSGGSNACRAELQSTKHQTTNDAS